MLVYGIFDNLFYVRINTAFGFEVAKAQIIPIDLFIGFQNPLPVNIVA